MPPDKRAATEVYVATEALYIYNAASGTMPQLARRAGDVVTAHALAKNPEWRDKVRRAGPPPEEPEPAPPARGKTKGA
jgi:hypothetical protein